MNDQTNRTAQIIIVGSGITGLTLAAMLERINISYLVLEAYPSVTPNVGAGILLYPNGLRILDQLGMYGDLREIGQKIERAVTFDSSTSKPLSIVELGNSSIERYGYETIVLGRYDVVAVLEKHIKQKERLLPNKKVIEVETLEDRVLVHCQDGSTYEGQIAVGADGVHSAVRKEMWKAAEKLEPGAIPEEDKEGVRCEFGSFFGTATPTGDVRPGDIVGSALQDHNCGVFTGKDGKIFYFWHFKLPGSQIASPNALPRFTKEKGLKSANQWPDLRASSSGKTTFKDVLGNTVRCGTTALPHYVFRRWSFRRIVIIGDAAHKPNPLTGQGGNNCIESASALVNALSHAFATDNVPLQGQRWPASTIATAFQMLQQQRIPRIHDVIDKSMKAQYVVAWSNWRYKFISRFISPLLSRESHLQKMYADITRGLKLAGKEWQIEPRPHAIPFDDEKPAQAGTLTSDATALIILGITILMAGLAIATGAATLRSGH